MPSQGKMFSTFMCNESCGIHFNSTFCFCQNLCHFNCWNLKQEYILFTLTTPKCRYISVAV
uniref:Uncharacterized protein n=1 Tax=Arundo donax TaxID=35708 RepID=A0A0A9DKL0_ARUDO